MNLRTHVTTTPADIFASLLHDQHANGEPVIHMGYAGGQVYLYVAGCEVKLTPEEGLNVAEYFKSICVWAIAIRTDPDLPIPNFPGATHGKPPAPGG